MGFNEKLWADTRRNKEDITLSNSFGYNFKKEYKVMEIAPTITLGVASGASTLTNPIMVSSVDGTTFNKIFKFSRGEYTRAGDVFSANLYIAGVSVTKPSYGGDIVVEFIHSGLSFEIKERGQAGKYRISVDEGFGYEYVTLLPQDGAPANGSQYFRKVEFATFCTRKIKIEMFSMWFGGVSINGNDTISTPEKEFNLEAIFLGDSFTEGTGANWLFDAYSNIASTLIGVGCQNSGVGGTGYINPGTGGRVKFRDRVQHDVISFSPDYCFISGGINDSAQTPEGLSAEAQLLYTDLKTGIPNTNIIVLSPWWPRTPDANILSLNIALKNTALLNNLPYIDVLNGITYNSKGIEITNDGVAWITGTGKVGATTTTGNSSVMTSSDGTHPTQNGHNYLGKKLAIEWLKIIKDGLNN